MIYNQTPYLGNINLKFEKFPYYRGSVCGILNKVHLNLGFTKLVSRMCPYEDLDGTPIVDKKKVNLINQFTGGVVCAFSWGEIKDDFVLENSFLSKNGDYIGSIESGWWYYKNNLVVLSEYPHGVAIKLKSYSPKITYKNHIKDVDENFITEQIENNNFLGVYGYSHRGGDLFTFGDRIFDENYIPSESDYTQKDWNKFQKKYDSMLRKSDEFDKKWLEEDGISSVIPFKMRGSKIVKTFNDAKNAAINLSKYLS